MDTTNIILGRRSQEKQAHAEEMRRAMTPTENLLWQHLRANRLDGLHFRRQQVIDGFIADFYCHMAGLIIEADGAIHDNRAEYDTMRDRIIAARGLQVLRFTNTQIEKDLKTVLDEIRATAHARITTYKAQSQK